jgi:phage terminase large subunit-like protein
MTRDYAAIAWQYAANVVSGEIPNGKWAIKACARSLRDRDNQNAIDFPFIFDEAKAVKVCTFIERLPHIKGILAGKLIHLENWQVWVVSQIFGWIHANGYREGIRRFRRAYIEVGRGNAKSTLSSAIGLWMLTADGDGGAEVYSCATTQDQARIVFDTARAMARSPVAKKLMDHLGVEVLAHSIAVVESNSMFVPLAADSKSQDGLNISLCVIDELHAHKTRDLFDVIVTGCGKREQSLLFAITTAGTNRAGICFEQHLYLRKILDQVAEDESQFGCIWSGDEDDDFRDSKVWKKANPNFAISVDPSHLENEARKAGIMPAAQNNFRTKHICQWVSASSAWMDMTIWNRCGDDTLKLEDFDGRDCFLGLDLASVSDLAAKVYLFPEQIDGETHYTLFGTYYLSDAAIRDGRNSQYEGWEISGYLTSTEGDVTSYQRIEDDIKADLKRFKVIELAFDPHQAAQMIQNLQGEDITAVQISQTVMNLSAPTKELERLARTGRLHHDNNPVLAWAASNVVVRVDTNENVKPRKEREENKIDPIIATINALARAMLHQPEIGDLLILI